MSRKFQVKSVPSTWLENNGRRLDCGPYLSGAIEARELLEAALEPRFVRRVRVRRRLILHPDRDVVGPVLECTLLGDERPFRESVLATDLNRDL